MSHNKPFATLFGARLALLLGMMMGWGGMAEGAAVLTLKGETQDVKQKIDSEVRLSLLSFSEDEAKAVTSAYGDYQQNQNAEALTKVLQDQQTHGYLFTKAAAGYTVKYAWQDPANVDRMVLLVTPALKTRNPYIWKTPNESPEPFTLLEVRKDGEQFNVKSSLDTEVELNDSGQLELQDYEGADTFATLKDDTPYYVKQGS